MLTRATVMVAQILTWRGLSTAACASKRGGFQSWKITLEWSILFYFYSHHVMWNVWWMGNIRRWRYFLILLTLLIWSFISSYFLSPIKWACLLSLIILCIVMSLKWRCRFFLIVNCLDLLSLSQKFLVLNSISDHSCGGSALRSLLSQIRLERICAFFPQ